MNANNHRLFLLFCFFTAVIEFSLQADDSLINTLLNSDVNGQEKSIRLLDKKNKFSDSDYITLIDYFFKPHHAESERYLEDLASFLCNHGKRDVIEKRSIRIIRKETLLISNPVTARESSVIKVSKLVRILDSSNFAAGSGFAASIRLKNALIRMLELTPQNLRLPFLAYNYSVLSAECEINSPKIKKILLKYQLRTVDTAEFILIVSILMHYPYRLNKNDINILISRLKTQYAPDSVRNAYVLALLKASTYQGNLNTATDWIAWWEKNKKKFDPDNAALKALQTTKSPRFFVSAAIRLMPNRSIKKEYNSILKNRIKDPSTCKVIKEQAEFDLILYKNYPEAKKAVIDECKKIKQNK